MPNYQIKIQKDLIHEMPIVQFPGPIYVIDSMLNVRAAIATLRKHKIVGFDTETRPSFKKGRMHSIALVQLSTKEEAFLFRVNKIGMPAALADLLSYEIIMKVGLSVHDDFNQLHRSFPGLKPQGFVDIQDEVKKYKIADISLQKVYAILFGKKISKSQQLTNWEAEQLDKGQCSYAAIDALACIHIHEHLAKGLFDPEQSPYKVYPEEEAE